MVNTWICTSDDHPICFFITKPERHMWTANAAVDDNWVPCMAGYRGERPKDRVRGVWQNLFWGGPSWFLHWQWWAAVQRQRVHIRNSGGRVSRTLRARNTHGGGDMQWRTNNVVGQCVHPCGPHLIIGFVPSLPCTTVSVNLH